MTTRLIPAVLAAIFLALLTACESKVTPENYELIKTGMTLSEVEHILGPGTLEDSSGVNFDYGGTLSTSQSAQKVYLWEDGGIQIIISFDANNTVVSKRKSGFE